MLDSKYPLAPPGETPVELVLLPSPFVRLRPRFWVVSDCRFSRAEVSLTVQMGLNRTLASAKVVLS